MIGSAEIAQTTNLIEQIITQAVVRPTGNPGLTGISGFLFDIVGSEDVSIDSDITDHYVEENYAIQDHIALRPERFTVKGYAGEIYDRFSDGVKVAMTVLDKLAILSTMAPEFAAQAEQLYSSLVSGSLNVSQIINTGTSLYDIFVQAITTSTRQQAAFNYFYALWKSRTLCTVETPWNVFTDMAIESIRGHQGEDSKYISDFSVTFKKIRKAEVAVSVGISIETIVENSKKYAGRAADMVSAVVSKGVTSGRTVESDLVFNTGALTKRLEYVPVWTGA